MSQIPHVLPTIRACAQNFRIHVPSRVPSRNDLLASVAGLKHRAELAYALSANSEFGDPRVYLYQLRHSKSEAQWLEYCFVLSLQLKKGDAEPA